MVLREILHYEREGRDESNDIKQWLQQYNTSIRKALTSTNDDYEKYMGSFPNRGLSEIGLCASMWHMLLPSGFVPQLGEVTILDNKGRRIDKRSHVFAVNRRNILCLTFGQYYDDQFPAFYGLQPGDRVRKYQELGPELIFVLDKQIAALSGPVNTIKDKMHLLYTFK